MTSEIQVEANQRNAQKSTGPRTVEGKETSSLNAVKHGLSSVDSAAYRPIDDFGQTRLDGWKFTFPPCNVEQCALVETVAAQDERIRRCRRVESSLIEAGRGRAEHLWDVDRAAEADELGRKLKRRPAVVVSQLKRNLHGAQWLLTRWGLFWKQFDAAGGWTPTLRNLAQDLLGLDEYFRVVPESDDSLTSMIHKATDSLQSLAEAYHQDDASSRAIAMEGLSAELSKELKLVRRYEQDAYRRRDRALDELKRQHGWVAQPIRKDVNLIPPRCSGANGFVSSNRGMVDPTFAADVPTEPAAVPTADFEAVATPTPPPGTPAKPVIPVVEEDYEDDEGDDVEAVLAEERAEFRRLHDEAGNDPTLDRLTGAAFDKAYGALLEQAEAEWNAWRAARAATARTSVKVAQTKIAQPVATINPTPETTPNNSGRARKRFSIPPKKHKKRKSR